MINIGSFYLDGGSLYPYIETNSPPGRGRSIKFHQDQNAGKRRCRPGVSCTGEENRQALRNER